MWKSRKQPEQHMLKPNIKHYIEAAKNLVYNTAMYKSQHSIASQSVINNSLIDNTGW